MDLNLRYSMSMMPHHEAEIRKKIRSIFPNDTLEIHNIRYFKEEARLQIKRFKGFGYGEQGDLKFDFWNERYNKYKNKLQEELIKQNKDDDNNENEPIKEDILFFKRKLYLNTLGIYNIGIKEIDLKDIRDSIKQREDFELHYNSNHKNLSGKFYIALRLILAFVDEFGNNKTNKEWSIKEERLKELFKKHYKTIKKHNKKIKEHVNIKGINSFANMLLDRGKTNLEIIKQNDQYIVKLKS